jgi:hypothetical protein
MKSFIYSSPGDINTETWSSTLGVEPGAATPPQKKSTVRKPKMWPWNNQTDWNRPMQRKRINEMRLATLNVRMLYRAGAMNEMVKEMERYKIEVCALQEIRWPGKGRVVKKNYMILY